MLKEKRVGFLHVHVHSHTELQLRKNVKLILAAYTVEMVPKWTQKEVLSAPGQKFCFYFNDSTKAIGKTKISTWALFRNIVLKFKTPDLNKSEVVQLDLTQNYFGECVRQYSSDSPTCKICRITWILGETHSSIHCTNVTYTKDSYSCMSR